jgi:hypothetical protein
VTLSRILAWYAPAAIQKRARVAVRTPSGKPLVCVEVLESGVARLFTDRRCF